PDTRHALLADTARALDGVLDDGPLAFEWARRAYQQKPDTDGLSALIELAERRGLWQPLIECYEQVQNDAAAPAPPLEVSQRLADVCAQKLADPARALALLRRALPADPEARVLLADLERLANAAERPDVLLDIYAQVLGARASPRERIELLRLRAG